MREKGVYYLSAFLAFVHLGAACVLGVCFVKLSLAEASIDILFLITIVWLTVCLFFFCYANDAIKSRKELRRIE